ncbi:MAG: 4Fe-4S dicluster domain-containing protein [Verrucomicrobiaceae bacterium]|nr:4Fe-4S dicluster domain-containing protein [Verrucomicrobiaceae bacterium]
MLKTGIDFEKCCGCGACVQACPKKAIVMQKDADGFLFPQIDATLCIDCGLCAKVCPINADAQKALVFNQAQYAVASVHKNKVVAEESSSGGAFTAIAQAFADECECVFFGAEMQEDFSVQHRKAFSIDELSAFRKSKYIPSNTATTFAEAKTFLKEGKYVLFSGTPCQIAGLKLFIGEKLSEKLFTIDFSCHGVGSPNVWKKYIADIEKKYSSKVVKFDFRAKARNFATYSSQSSRITFANGKEIVRFKDPWFKAFVSALFKRSSCKDCPFSQQQRISDATIADFWGIERISKNWNSGRGVSLILLNTPKSQNLFKKISNFADVEKFPFEECLKYNIPLREKVVPHNKSEHFKELLNETDFENALLSVLGKQTILQRLTNSFLMLFPIRTQHTITRLTKSITGGGKILLLKVLPNSVGNVVMKKWAKLNGREFKK